MHVTQSTDSSTDSHLRSKELESGKAEGATSRSGALAELWDGRACAEIIGGTAGLASGARLGLCGHGPGWE